MTDTLDEPVTITGEEELDELVETHHTVLVDFYAEWCGPCRMLAPVLEELAAETSAAVAKVDIDTRSGLANAYDVRSIPTLILYADGERVERLVGARQKGKLEELLSEHLPE